MDHWGNLRRFTLNAISYEFTHFGNLFFSSPAGKLKKQLATYQSQGNLRQLQPPAATCLKLPQSPCQMFQNKWFEADDSLCSCSNTNQATGRF